MPDYSKNFLTSMTGYTDLSDPSEDPKPEAYLPKGKTSADITADIRDLLSNAVGSNITSWQDISSNEDAKAKYGALINAVGRPLATKLLTQVISFNTREDLRNAPIEKRIQSFYDIGSADKEVARVLGDVKSFGYGVVPGYRESVLYGNQVLGGRLKEEGIVENESSVKAKELINARIQK